MITRKVNLTIKNNKSKPDSKIYLYRKDRGVVLQFTLIDNPYTLDNMYAGAVIVPPTKQAITIPKEEVLGNIISIKIESTILDQLEEVGEHICHIHLFDKDNNRVTVPAFSIFVEDTVGDMDEEYFVENILEGKQALATSISNLGEATIPTALLIDMANNINIAKKGIDTAHEQEINNINNATNAGKTLIAEAITSKGVATQGTDTFEVIAGNIGNLQTVRPGENVIGFDSNGYFLGDLVLPSSITSIGNYAFYHCEKIKSITLPDGLTMIGRYAFDSCKTLIAMSIPKTVTEIGEHAFSYCNSLKSINIPDGIKVIKQYTFSECVQLSSIKLPISVTTLEDGAFYSCSNIISVNIPKSIISLGRSVFSFTGLTTITIPDNVIHIHKDCLSYCSKLSNLVLYKDFDSHLNLSSSPITKECLLDMLSKLKNNTGLTGKTLTLGYANLNKLTSEEKAIATNKNWTLA